MYEFSLTKNALYMHRSTGGFIIQVEKSESMHGSKIHENYDINVLCEKWTLYVMLYVIGENLQASKY